MKRLISLAVFVAALLVVCPKARYKAQTRPAGSDKWPSL